MIGKLSGRIDFVGDDHILLDVAGVGYVVFCSDRTLRALPRAGGFAALYTDLLVREDILQLFGFPSLVEKEWHRLLMSVQGIGAKASLAILGALGPDGVGRAIALGDWSALKAAKGVGPKSAQRVVNELKDKAPSIMAMGAASPIVVGQGAAAVSDAKPMDIGPVARPVPGATAQGEAMSALANLGYPPAEAAAAVAQALDAAPELELKGLIRDALKILAPKG